MADVLRVWQVVGRRLFLAVLLFGLLPTAFLACYVSLYGAPIAAMLPHVLVASSFLAFIAGLRLLVSTIPLSATARRAVAAATLAAAILAMLFFYGFVFVGLSYWARVTTFDLASTYFFQAPGLIRTLGYPPIGALLVCLFVVLVAWLLAYKFLIRFDWVPPFAKATSRVSLLIVAIGLIAIAVLSALLLPDRNWGTRGEPLSLSLFPEQAEATMQSHAIDVFHAAEIDREENVVRESYQPAVSAKHSNVIVIVSDALRADHLSLFGYGRETSPHLKALETAGNIKLATSAVTVCNESSCGLRALASSRYLDRQAVKPITLEEVLRRYGYKVHLVFSGDHTNFYGLADLYGKVDSYFDGASQTARYLNDDRLVTDRLRQFPVSDGTPTMFQFHLMSSHALGQRFDNTPSFGPGENYTGARWGSPNPNAPKQATNFYDRGVLQADRVISEILTLLDERGYLKDAVVVITGDHGESLGERGLYSHTHSVWEESLRVPLVLMSFGNASVVGLQPSKLISQVDIAPTLLRALEMGVPSTWEGEPIQDLARKKLIYFQQAQLIGLVDGRDAAVLYKHWNDLKTGNQFTFDLLADPRESKNITDQIPDALRRDWRSLLISRSAALSQKVKHRLEASRMSNH